MAETIRLAVTDWPPYYYKDRPDAGEHSRIVNKLFKRAGLNIEYIWYNNWKAAFNTVKAGRNDGTPSWRCNKERAKYFTYTMPFIVDPYVFFHLKETLFTWTDYSQLKQWEPIGVTESYFYGEPFHQTVDQNQIHLHQVRIDGLMIRLLLKGRIQLALMSHDNGISLIRRTLKPLQQQQITFHPKPVTSAISHIIFSKKFSKHLQVVKRLNNQIISSSDLFDEKMQKLQQQWTGCY